MAQEKRTGFMRKIARELYRRGHSSKTALVSDLGVSLPSILQNVRALMDRGVVIQDGLMESTGGRKAELLSLNGEHACAIGVDVTGNHLSLVAVDLRGALRCHERLALPFSADTSYCEALSRALEAFLHKHAIDESRVLGAGLSLPGILSPDGRMLADSHALHLSQYPLDALERACRFPVLAVNDANAAALAEKRLLAPDVQMVYLSLSNSVGGAIFMGGALYAGDHGRSGEFGHMPVVPDGRECYCGKRGCYDAYGSALLLSTPYGGKLQDFFAALANGEERAKTLWQEYLRYLAVMCSHLRMAFDCTVMLGGYVGAFLEPHLCEVQRAAARLNTFENDGRYICLCHYKTEAAAAGAALMHIERYLDAL